MEEIKTWDEVKREALKVAAAPLLVPEKTKRRLALREAFIAGADGEFD